MSTHSDRDWLSERRSFLAALLLGAPRGSLCHQASTWAPLFSVQRWSCRYPLLYELWCELCNAPRRILGLHEIGAEDNGIDLQVWGGRECRAGDAEYRSRSEGIQNLQKRRPWAGLSDVVTFLEGHAWGVEFAAHNQCKPKQLAE